MLRPAVAAVSALSLCGCTTPYSPLYSPGAISAAATAEAETDAKSDCQTDSDPMKQTLACAEVLQTIYSRGYKDTSDWHDMYQLPIIGAAAAAALILLNGKDNAAKRVAKVGLAAGVVTAAKDQYLPNDAPTTFIKGHGALGCVIAYGDYFHGTTAVQGQEQLQKALSEAEGLRVIVSALRYQPIATDPKVPAEAELLQSARALADQALSQSATQIDASATQLGSFKFAAPVFRKAVTDIAAWVASKGRVRPNQSYDQLVGKFHPEADVPAAAQQLGFVQAASSNYLPASSSGTEGIATLAKATTLLANTTIQLKGMTPDYAAQLTNVRACASGLSTG